MIRRVCVAVLLVFSVCAATQDLAPPSRTSTGETPVWSNDFVDTIGENTHCSFAKIGWVDCKNPDAAAQAIEELGVRHLRDGFSDYWKGYRDSGSPHIPTYVDGGVATPVTTFYNRLAKATGVRLDFPIGLTYGNHAPYAADVIAAVPSAEALELGGNEPDSPYNSLDLCPSPNPNGISCWVTDSTSQLHYYSNSVKAAGLKRVGPSIEFGKGYTCSNVPGSQKVVLSTAQCPVSGAANVSVFGDQSADLDSNNLHHYAGEKHPGNPVLINYRDTLQTSTAPISNWITETGYGTGHDGNADVRIAKYEPRIFAEAYYRGIQRTYQFEMFDQPKAAAGPYFDTFGLVSVGSNLMFKPKLQYEALRSLIQIMNDPGSRPALAPLSYSLSGGDSKLHHILAQRRDGTYQLLLWVEGPDPTPAETVSISVCGPAMTFGTVSRFTPDNGQYANSSITPRMSGGCHVFGPLNITDAMQIYRFGTAAFKPAVPMPTLTQFGMHK